MEVLCDLNSWLGAIRDSYVGLATNGEQLKTMCGGGKSRVEN